MGLGDLQPQVTGANIGEVDASATPYVNIFTAPCACVLTGINLVQAGTLAAHATNFATCVVTNITDSQEVARITTETAATGVNALAPDTAEALALSSTASYLELDKGDVLQAAFTEGGTATTGDLTEAALFVEWVPGTGAGQ